MDYMKCLKIFFKLLCFFLAAFSICCLFYRWLQNKDESSIGFRRYNNKEQDVYPTFSFCFRSTGNGGLFTNFEDDLVQTFDFRPSDFEDLMKGEIVKGVTGYKDLRFENFSDIRYEQYMVKFEDIVMNLEFSTVNDHDAYTYDDFTGHGNVTGRNKEWRFYISRVDPTTICFSRKSKFDVKNLIRKKDAILFSLADMKKWNRNLYLDVYVHHPGQLSRVFDKPIFNTILRVVNGENNHLIFSISQVSVLRKRPNANLPCDPNLQDDELKFKEVVIETTGCTPNYWDTFIDLRNLSDQCTCSSQL